MLEERDVVRGGRHSLLGLQVLRRLWVRRRLLPVEVIDGTLRMSRGEEDRASVVPEHGEPVRDVGRVILARLERKTKVGREERRAELGDELLASVACIAPALAAEVAVEP
jgi:hypothetical protein